ncbi:MAG TPA: CocE/NonD family hydrolase [Candidatus Binatia bacterium]|nr:CocE/NonD family hydrolase [Candidatus Binatia bacterium]
MAHPACRNFVAASLAALIASPAHAALVTSVFGGRVPCAPSGAVQVCESGVTQRVETWDGVALGVTVTIPPATMDGPFPLVVDLHGFGAGKTPNPAIQALAEEGFIVLIYTARGLHESCGSEPARAPDPSLSNPNVCEERGWIHLADARYEGRDTQYLAGILVDEGLVVPDKIGVTGISYGGGQSMMLAQLRNRVMMPDGSLVPWRSPAGVDMTIAASAPVIGWSDLAYAFVPTGKFLDYSVLNAYGDSYGIMKDSFVDFLYQVAVGNGYVAPPGADPDADITSWYNALVAGEPYDTSPLLVHAREQLTRYHSAYYIDDSIAPAPLHIFNSFTDDIMPVSQALRFYLKTKNRYPGAEVSLRFSDDFSHMRGVLGDGSDRVFLPIVDFLRRHLKGIGTPGPVVETYTQGCNGALEEGPFTAASWDAIHPGEVRLLDAGPDTFDSEGGIAGNASAEEPTLGGANSCRTVSSSADDPGAATYRFPAAGCDGYTVMGMPTIIARYAVDGTFPTIIGRLWDVDTVSGSQTLVSHAFYRPDAGSEELQVFQLDAIGWHFAPGHVAKVELLGESSPYARKSNGTFTITATDVDVRLPVLETPDGSCVAAPAPGVYPGGLEFPGQVVLGARLAVKDPGFSVGQNVLVQARERDSDVAIVGDPTVNGARLRVVTRGGESADQTFELPASGWSIRGPQRFRYDNRVPGGAVRKAQIEKTPRGVVRMKATISGRNGTVEIVPPDPGEEAAAVLTIVGGNSYCTSFGGEAGGIETADGDTLWSIKRPTSAVCLDELSAPATTTTLPVTTTTLGGTTTTLGGATTTLATTTTQAGPTTTVTTTSITLPLEQCGIYPTCGGDCPEGKVCSIVFANPFPDTSQAGCACVEGFAPCGGFQMCGGLACPENTACFSNPFPPEACGCFQQGP